MLYLIPFCGCGTTLEAAQRLNRKWIGIDIAFHAIKRVSAVRLNKRCGLREEKDYEITGIPQTLEGADHLWKRDSYHFQTWAVSSVDGFVTARRNRDGGVDGRLYFHDDEETKAMKIEVKGGSKVRIESLRALAGILDERRLSDGRVYYQKNSWSRSKTKLSGLCNSKGTVNIRGVEYPRLQLLCIEEIFDGKRFNTPLVRGKSKTDQLDFLSNENP